ncbi:MAG: hypothetical protein CO031_02545 [Candidatus Nealsonbacteria bacterium CG_4_9_14_0_2_um_filter_37_38]|uniref:starch synthase n=1 Tax=Candidatus Nealsonbacteria bacterium CG_4_10_14_0_8_um_filter_37_14 TaxID=1974684 RepID=A0A2M7R6E0_9BACT|nr:MAG: hypothetical protein COV63_01785 [Candidatus Nealsonbacteria bacterium CG11_big_fil_rev_8_21_14_0_20_37_68]PIW91801.1 MAG: hypothetical protein COZ89_03275 [Candidatus Nealsonbacteria bacterium CG_4_8_14_3_um_filter_37_23]PIY89156.1 MAG: hypothetical protein COY73_01800 [Candidatus Nealsonbacteria bacterium CG_4_10_14_0_8_um_filter_37_14]PJC51470.1 MAG: hypothetical protein CO031_02545 [Candidatus Nealsonbacteria bacterium CG_4_9_14_0_2_um_filter_37_38]
METMERNYNIVFVTPEMMIPELEEPACEANFRGGLGILSGDIMEGLTKRGINAKAIVPFYDLNWVTREKINYDKTSAQFLFELSPQINGRRDSINIWKINRAGTELFGLHCPDILNVLYTADRWQRLRQEVLIGHTVPALLKKLEIRPDIVWLQEGHTATVIPAMKEDSYFNGEKFLFTTHTSCPEGMEKFYGGWVNELGIKEKYHHNIFIRNGLIDMTWAAMSLADGVTAVSDEHCEVTKRMFPDFAGKVVGIRNGLSRDLWLSPRIKMIENNFNPYNLWEAQQADKKEFIDFIERKTRIKFNSRKPLLGWVRRIAWYKNQYPMLAPVIRAICAERGEFVDTDYGRLEGLGIQVFSAGRAHESDAQCLGWMAEFERWMSDPHLAGKFIFRPEYNLELLKNSARGCDIWFNCPLLGWEACGASDQRAAENGRINLTPRTGGAREYIEEFNPATGKGNGFFLEPYHPITIYNKLKTVSDLYYAWIEKGKDLWLKLCMGAFESGKSLDIVDMIAKYEQIFEKLLKK